MIAPQGKKQYVAPKLETHGTIEELTGQRQSGTGLRKVTKGPLGGGPGTTEERPFGS